MSLIVYPHYKTSKLRISVPELVPASLEQVVGLLLVGHVAGNGSIYCCAHCASMAGTRGAQDRV